MKTNGRVTRAWRGARRAVVIAMLLAAGAGTPVSGDTDQAAVDIPTEPLPGPDMIDDTSVLEAVVAEPLPGVPAEADRDVYEASTLDYEDGWARCLSELTGVSPDEIRRGTLSPLVVDRVDDGDATAAGWYFVRVTAYDSVRVARPLAVAQSRFEAVSCAEPSYDDGYRFVELEPLSGEPGIESGALMTSETGGVRTTARNTVFAVDRFLVQIVVGQSGPADVARLDQVTVGMMEAMAERIVEETTGAASAEAATTAAPGR